MRAALVIPVLRQGTVISRTADFSVRAIVFPAQGGLGQRERKGRGWLTYSKPIVVGGIGGVRHRKEKDDGGRCCLWDATETGSGHHHGRRPRHLWASINKGT